MGRADATGPRAVGVPRNGRLRVDVVATSVPRGLSRRSHSAAKAGLGRWLAEVAPARARGHVTVALVSDAEVRALNLRYRRKDSPTDVLSFPYDEPDGPVGDVIISIDRALAQAAERGHSLQRELELLALHGALHVCGYDHETDDGEMERIERRLRRKLLRAD